MCTDTDMNLRLSWTFVLALQCVQNAVASKPYHCRRRVLPLDDITHLDAINLTMFSAQKLSGTRSHSANNIDKLHSTGRPALALACIDFSSGETLHNSWLMPAVSMILGECRIQSRAPSKPPKRGSVESATGAKHSAWFQVKKNNASRRSLHHSDWPERSHALHARASR